MTDADDRESIPLKNQVLCIPCGVVTFHRIEVHGTATIWVCDKCNRVNDVEFDDDRR